MTNRKLVKTGLLTNGALLLLAVITTAGTLLPATGPQQTMSDSIQWVKFNPELLELSGLPDTEAANAPLINLNKQAASFTDVYLSKNTDDLELIKARSATYFTVMDEVFTKYNLPKQLKYLAVVESELKTKAVSRVGAVGAWQLMPGTARIFALKVNAKKDERTHLYKSTVAAARYLNDLHGIFDDWLLTIAAYNSGPGPVFKAIKKAGSRNFWKLQAYLPAETRGHVKRFIATHYYFEGEGSVTTLTKAETDAFTKKMIAFVAEQNLLIEQKLMAKNTAPVSQQPGGHDKIADINGNPLGLRNEEEE